MKASEGRAAQASQPASLSVRPMVPDYKERNEGSWCHGPVQHQTPSELQELAPFQPAVADQQCNPRLLTTRVVHFTGRQKGLSCVPHRGAMDAGCFLHWGCRVARPYHSAATALEFCHFLSSFLFFRFIFSMLGIEPMLHTC